MPNTSFSLSFSVFIFFYFILFFLVHLSLKKIELQHIVVFDLYKKQLLVISGRKKTRHLQNFLIPLGGIIRFTIYIWFPREKNPKLLQM